MAQIPVREGHKTRDKIRVNDKFGGESVRSYSPLKGGRTSCGGPEDSKLEPKVGGWRYSLKKVGSHGSHRRLSFPSLSYPSGNTAVVGAIPSFYEEECSVPHPLSSELEAWVPPSPTLTHQASHAVPNNSHHVSNVLIFGEDHVSSRGQGSHVKGSKTQRGQDLTTSSARTPQWVFGHRDIMCAQEGGQ